MPLIDPGDDWEDAGSDLDALVAPEEDPGPEIPVVQVTNPSGPITVTAHLAGSLARVDLSPGVVRWTESELAAAITELAEVAAKRATAVMHVTVVEMFVAQGVDRTEARDFVASNLPFATPDQADAALAELSTRYAHGGR